MVKKSFFDDVEDHFSPLEIKNIDNFEKAFRIFRMLVQKERVLSKFKEKMSYEKPSQKKRRKLNESKQRQFELEMKQKKILSGEYSKEKNKKHLKKENKILRMSEDNNE